VLDLVVPILPSTASSTDLINALLNESSAFVSYLLSFFIAGVWWTAHFRHYERIRRSNLALRWLNLLFLLWIALLPFFTKILETYGNLQAAVVIYALGQAAAGFCLTISWLYASKNHRLIDKNMTADEIRMVTFRHIPVPVIFLISIGLSFISPTIAFASWYTIAVVYAIVFILEQKARKSAS
ncbi:MAG TPA: TMEM175 family protein, partial [Acidobacteriota bacterium]|nr:TMEM175 family protein [Acidobacteriota bacterium]